MADWLIWLRQKYDCRKSGTQII
ncbi:UNVERIFIED_CONTAM: hypothetical protein GTU68_000387 [Idotea baltica]|nr:hypothetical protein [Idotea baltica]